MNELTLKEAIEHLENELSNPNHKWECEQCKKENEQILEWLKALDIIENELLELKSIKEAHPSEALKCFDIIGYLITKTTEDNEYILLNEDKEFEKEYNTVKQVLLKTQKIEEENAKYKDFRRKIEIVKKALKEGIYARDPLDKNKLKYISAVALSNVGDEWYLSNHCDFCVNVRDYKTLFWLKEDNKDDKI